MREYVDNARLSPLLIYSAPRNRILLSQLKKELAGTWTYGELSVHIQGVFLSLELLQPFRPMRT